MLYKYLSAKHEIQTNNLQSPKIVAGGIFMCVDCITIYRNLQWSHFDSGTGQLFGNLIRASMTYCANFNLIYRREKDDRSQSKNG